MFPTEHPLVRALAAGEHERWAGWQKYLHYLCTQNADGSLTIPASLVARWERQIVTPFADLSEQEQASDVQEVERTMRTIVEAGYVVIADEPDHFVTFDPERWTVEHSVACRISGRMTQCEYHTAVAKVASEGVDTDNFGRWRITGVDSEGLPMLERADG